MPTTVQTHSKITPNYENSRDRGANYNAIWLGKIINWNIDVDGDETWLIWRENRSVNWPYGPNAGAFPHLFQPSNEPQGKWGREVNFHNHPSEPYLWNIKGTSALAVDFMHGVQLVHSEPQQEASLTCDWRMHTTTLYTKAVWHTIIVQVIWGRNDGTTPRPGRVRVWVDGNNTPVVDTGNIHTLYRYNDGSGIKNQKLWSLYNGFYTRGMIYPTTVEIDRSYPRVGRTFAQAIADTTPGAKGITDGYPQGNDAAAVAWSLSDLQSNAPSSYGMTGNYSLGPAVVSEIASATDSDFVIPSSLGGSPVVTPTNQTLPSISGIVQAGQTLTVVQGGWSNSPTAYTYQWQLEITIGSGTYANIGGATAQSYIPVSGEVGKKIRVVETASNAGGSASATSTATAAVAAAGVTPNPVPGITHWFGNVTIGVDNGAMGVDSRRGSSYLATEDLDITDVWLYCAGNVALGAGSTDIKAVIYEMGNPPGSGGLPSNKLGESAQVAVSYNAGAAWRQFSFASPVKVVAGRWYEISFHTGGTADAVIIYRLAAGGFFFFKSGDTYSDGADSTWGVSNDVQTYNIAAFAAGVLSGVVVPPPINNGARRLTVRSLATRRLT